MIETERFLLRGYRPGDLATFTAFYASPRSRYVGGPMTAELACRAFMTYAGHWHVRGYGRWMVEEKATGATLGNVGLWYPDGWPEPEIGWTLFEGAEGRGVAFETAFGRARPRLRHAGLDHGDQPHRAGKRPLPRAGRAAGRGARRRLHP